MKPLAALMAGYGAYHRDPRNRATHFVGIPLIMFSLLIPLGWLRWSVAGIEVSLALVFLAALLVYYFRLDKALALAMSLFVAILWYYADGVAQQEFSTSLGVFLVTFILGWLLQLLGHVFEGRRPALVDNVLQIFIAPIFLMAELFFLLGLKKQLHRELIERARHPSPK